MNVLGVDSATKINPLLKFCKKKNKMLNQKSCSRRNKKSNKTEASVLLNYWKSTLARTLGFSVENF